MLSTLSDFDRIPRILRLNIAGRSIDWVSWQEAVCLYSRDLVVWMVGEPLVSIRALFSASVLFLHAQSPRRG